MLPTFETVIVGAGPYGLSLAAHMRARGASDLAVVGQPMASWRLHMPIGMRLRSEAFASSLWDPDRSFTLENYCRLHGIAYRPVGMVLQLADFLQYAEWFQSQAVPAVEDRTLAHLRRRDDCFEISFTDGGLATAKNVVLATGIVAHRHLPKCLRSLRGELVLHSSEVSEADRFAGKEIVIVGAGQSALETAALLHEAGARVTVVVRAPAVVWNIPSRTATSFSERLLHPEAGIGIGWRAWAFSELPRLFHCLPDRGRALSGDRWGPRGSHWVRERIEGEIPILTSHRIAGAAEHRGRITLTMDSAGPVREVEADVVIAATGYRFDVNRVSFLDPAIRAEIKTREGSPELSSVFESSIPGLYFIGAAAADSFGPAMRFIYGAKHCAPVLSRRFSRSVRRAARGFRAPAALPTRLSVGDGRSD